VKNFVLCTVVLLATGGGVAFLVASHHSTPPVVAAPPDTPAEPTPPTSDPDTPCPCCQPGVPGTVYDVTDLSARFAIRSEAKGEFVSFDEPPLAKPKDGVTPAKHEVAAPREVLPPPREVK
jgi:hypothetical protein